MNCPACDADGLQELTAACPACHFQLSDLDDMLGLPPSLRSSITDLADVLNQREMDKLASHLHEMELQFPQCRFAAVVAQTASKVSLPVYTFWLFNKGGISAPMERLGECRLVLLVLDVSTGAGTCMVGYGLEPFFSKERLQRVATAFRPCLLGGEYGDSIHAGLDVVQELLQQTAEQIPQIYGTSSELTLSPSLPRDEEEEFAY